MEEKIIVESSVPSISEEDLQGLPLYAIVALAARAAWRVLPGTNGLNSEALEAVTVALAAAGMTVLGERPDISMVLAASQEDVAANVAAIAAFSAAYAANFARGESVDSPANMSMNPTGDAIKTALDTITSSSVYIAGEAAATNESVRQDLEWLRDWSTQQRARDGLVGRDFFERALWERREAVDPPYAWKRLIEEWSEANAKGGLHWLVEMYHGMLDGRGPDWEQLSRFQGDWYRRYQEQEARKKKEEKGAVNKPKTKSDKVVAEEEEEAAPVPEPQPVLLKGGIVTAAADMPAKEDRLGRTPLVHTLADMLSSPEQSLPMTIALLGDWGSGKSSVILQLKERLKVLAHNPRRSHYLFAEFNAWEYEQTDNLRAGLAQEVVNGLTRDLGKWDKFLLAIRKAHKENFLEFWQSLAGLLLALIGIAFGVSMATPDEAQAALKQFDLIGGTGIAAFGAYLLLQAWRTGKRLLEHPLASQLKTYLQLPSYGEHLGEVPAIKQEIASLCRERLQAVPNGRLMVVVDDLDRCHPSAITEVFDAVRLVMNLPNVAVVIAIDDRIAFRAVADHYRNLAEDGKRSKEEIARDYLGKIIQLPLNLYKPWPWEVSGFIKDHLFKIEEKPKDGSSGGKGELTVASTLPKVEVDDRPEPSPAARRLLEEHGIDPVALQGSGQNGRILKKDIVAYLETQQRSGSQTPGAVLSQTPLQQNADVPPSNEKPTEPVSDDALDTLMQDSHEEREIFALLATEMGFSNPRQLIRLHNSYRMLKGYRHSRKKGELDLSLLDGLMHGLFWYEHLYQRKQKERRFAELVVWEWGKHPEWEQRAAKQEENPPAVVMARWVHGAFGDIEWAEKYRLLLQTVEMVVLPNAEMGLILNQSEADEVLRGVSTSDQPQIDPWS